MIIACNHARTQTKPKGQTMCTDLIRPDGHYDLDMLLQREDETLTHAACRIILTIPDTPAFYTLLADLKANWEPTPAAQLTKLLYAMLDAITGVYASEQTPDAN